MLSIRGIFYLAILALFCLPMIIETLALPVETDPAIHSNALVARGKKALLAGGLTGVLIHKKIKKHRKKKMRHRKKKLSKKYKKKYY
ncbi:hypothetical protein HI914_05180 [Erysiphe necator]|nr:hypothetical protein HI914_05180 [Erysiphe necator]